jgi:hypothetical protein
MAAEALEAMVARARERGGRASRREVIEEAILGWAERGGTVGDVPRIWAEAAAEAEQIRRELGLTA